MKKGITLLELILAIGMLSIVAVILFPIFAGYLRQAELKDTSKHLLGVLRRAQQFSQSQEGNDSWVVALWNVTSTDYFELYPSSTPTSKETFFFQSNIVFTDDTVPTSSVLKIKFEKFTGKGWYATSSDFINETKTLDLSLKNNPESKVTIEVSKEGKIAMNEGGGVTHELIGAYSTYYRTTISANCNPIAWWAMIDNSSLNYDYTGELTFDLIDLSEKTVTDARVCAYMYNQVGDVATNYIEKAVSSTCSVFPNISNVPANIGSLDIGTTYQWYCIPVNTTDVPVGGSFYIRWWGEDLDGSLSPRRAYRGPEDSNLNNCGGAPHPAGANDCRPYLDITYK